MQRRSLLIMMTMIVLSLMAIGSTAASLSLPSTVSVRNVDRSLYLNTQVVRDYSRVVYLNNGPDPVDAIYLSYRSSDAQHLALIWVMDGKNDITPVKVTSDQISVADSDVTDVVFYKVPLLSPLAAQGEITLTIGSVFTHVMSAHPSEIPQSDTQLMTLENNHYFYTPYPVQQMTTTIELPSEVVQSYSQLEPTHLEGKRIAHGPYNDVSPLSYHKMKLHFENNTPFVSASTLIREIEVSHWGNVAVEETYNLVHDGAKLKGGFSRFDYQRGQGMSGRNAVRGLVGLLPNGAADVYYRDQIGNVSTSHVNYEANEGVTLQLVPRFPLFGGWSVSFYFGYNLPAELYLATAVEDSNLFVLNMTYNTPLQNLVVDDMELRVILPEGATNIKLHTPFAVDDESRELHSTYLDTIGRPVVVAKAKNLVQEHSRYFQVTYSFSSSSSFMEPLLLITAYFVFFIVCMIYVRLEFSIGTNVELEEAERKQAIEDLVFQLSDLQERFDGLFDKIKNSSFSDKQAQKAATDKLVSEQREITTKMEDLNGYLATSMSAMEHQQSKKLEQMLSIQDVHASVKKSGKSIEAKQKAALKQCAEQLEEINSQIKALMSEMMEAIN